MHNYKKIIPIIGLVFGLFPSVLFAQVMTTKPYVIANAGGDTLLFSGFQLDFTVGEMAVSYRTSKDDKIIITEGFHQIDSPLPQPIVFSTESTENQCPDVTDGSITIAPSGCVGPYTIELAGSNGDTIIVDEIADSYTFMNLDSGNYRVTVRGVTFCAERDTVYLGLKNNTCDVKLYSGITPNGDGKNDFWVIDNIEINQPNEVQIFNRWGNKIWSKNNYNNRDIAWKGDNQNGAQLPSGTYFYTINVSGNSDASGSGWIQLTR